MKSPVTPVAVDQWQAILKEGLSITRDAWKRVIVLPQTDSTQDAARRMDAQIGDVIVAGRQTNGRGRMSNLWTDTGENGVAVTFVIARDRPERLAIASAVATADAIVATMKCTDGWQRRKVQIGIKWPNDILVEGRKIAGILIEQSDDRACVGIGVNVRQIVWPAALRGRAISLAELGFDVDRVVVVDLLMQSLCFTMRDDDDQLCASFSEADVLTGTTCGFRIGEREIRGKVLRVDPMKGLVVLTDNEGEMWLPAATTTVIKD